MQAESTDRHTEDQGRINVADPPESAVLFRRINQRTPGEKEGNQDIKHEEQEQEGLGHAEQGWLIIFFTPGPGQEEGGDKANEIEDAPGLEPGYGNNAEVDHRQVDEEEQVIFAASRRQNGRCKTAQGGDHGKRQGILQQRQQYRATGDANQQDKPEFRGNQRVQLHPGQRRQIENANPGPLQNHAITITPVAPAPAEEQQTYPGSCHAGITQADRHMGIFGDITQQEGEAEKKDQDANLDDGISANHPAGNKVRHP